VVLLQTRGRRSGKLRTTILLTANHEGERYLVSVTGGEAQWVRNVRAAGGEVFIRHGRCRAVRLEEVPVEQRAPVLKAYLKWALGARPLFEVSHKAPVEEFEGIAPRHPVFRIAQRDRPR
jgi:deazaflavin-dependent oxidoreductase (nitroreductase family)